MPSGGGGINANYRVIISPNYISRPYPRERPKKALAFLGWSDRVDRARKQRILFPKSKN